jgi:hypothetical protein
MRDRSRIYSLWDACDSKSTTSSFNTLGSLIDTGSPLGYGELRSDFQESLRSRSRLVNSPEVNEALNLHGMPDVQLGASMTDFFANDNASSKSTGDHMCEGKPGKYVAHFRIKRVQSHRAMEVFNRGRRVEDIASDPARRSIKASVEFGLSASARLIALRAFSCSNPK